MMRSGRWQKPFVLSPGISRRDFWQAASANFLFFCNINAFNLLPLYIQDLGGSGAEIGWIMGVYSLAAVLCQPLVGRFVERIGIKPFLLIGGASTLLASVLFAFLTALSPLFIVLRLLQGFGSSAFFIANFTLIAEIAPEKNRAEAVGVFGISGLITIGVAPALGELLIHALGYQIFFLATALCTLGSLVVIKDLKPPRMTVVAGSSADRGVSGKIFLPLTLCIIFGVASGALFAFLPPFAKEAGSERIGIFYFLYSASAIGVRLFGIRLADAWGRWKVLIPAFLSNATGIFLLLWADPLTALFWAGVLTGGAHGLLYPTLSALLVDGLALALKRPSLHRVALWNLCLGTAGASVAVFTGLRAGEIAKHSFEIWQVMERHERLGITTLVLGVVTSAFRLWKRDRLSPGLRAATLPEEDAPDYLIKLNFPIKKTKTMFWISTGLKSSLIQNLLFT
jgi:MFS family permease